MQRIIPRKTKVKLEFIRGITGIDLILGVIGAAIAVVLFASNFPGHFWIAGVYTIFFLSIFIKISEDERLYVTCAYLFRFMAQKKKFSVDSKKGKKGDISEMIPFEDIYQDRFINFGSYYGQVIEITPVLFGLLTEYTQDNVIESFANALRRLSPDQTCSIIKLNLAMVLDNYIYNENKKYELLLEMQYEHQVTDKEVEARSPVFEERVSFMENLNRKDKVYKDHFYVVVYDKDKDLLENTVNGMINALASSLAPVSSKRLYGTDLTVFLKANYGREFDQRDLESLPFSQYMDWAKPKKVQFKAAKYLIDDNAFRTYAITDYPLNVGNAWGADIFLLDRTKVVMKFNQVPKYNAERSIDKAIMDMESKLYKTGRSSSQIELQTHVETLRNLLVSLKNNNQQLYDVNTFITCEDAAKRDVKAMLKQSGFKFSEMFARQQDAFISSNISRRDNIKSYRRGIPTSTLAAVFPFISSALQDESGIYIGDNEYPVFVDFFKRDSVRVNSNMMVIGKSGSGKSYATKTLLANLAADNCKIFILDPEKEYALLTESLGGKYIDVGSSLHGILNPFHVISSLDEGEEEQQDDDEGEIDLETFQVKKKKKKVQVVNDSYSQHLQFLEQFFRSILEGISSDAFELLNSLIVDTYKKKGIDENTYIPALKPADFPIFDDLYALILDRIKTCKDEFTLRNLMTIETYIKKFATGGRNSKLWNGPTSIETNENFVCFNFQSLIANNNALLTNAQMLLVFRYLNNEIINNKDFNAKYHKGDKKNNRKIIVAVDEAHVFINPRYPIALDFMAQMAKRIRKYSGMQIVITQNIADFVGSEEIQRQSTAVINACQYSLIFALAPNDINDLVELYKKSGGINEEEQNAIVTATLGQAFLITGPTNRTMIQVVAQDYIRAMFSNPNE
ncbi:MAG TPA: hypothetical protein DEV78_01025 [Clostridiales bacterium]|nr:hypothetical protein [Clostridiales bacterium]